MNRNAQQISANMEPAEPVAGQRVFPIWLILLLGILVYGGMIYLDGHGGWFNPEVFEPFKDYAALSRSQPYDPERSYYALEKPRSTSPAPCAIR